MAIWRSQVRAWSVPPPPMPVSLPWAGAEQHVGPGTGVDDVAIRVARLMGRGDATSTTAQGRVPCPRRAVGGRWAWATSGFAADRMRTRAAWRWANIPLPEPHLVGLGIGLLLQLRAPWRLPGRRGSGAPSACRCSSPAWSWPPGRSAPPPRCTRPGPASWSAAARMPSAGTPCTSPRPPSTPGSP